jgi:Sortase domain
MVFGRSQRVAGGAGALAVAVVCFLAAGIVRGEPASPAAGNAPSAAGPSADRSETPVVPARRAGTPVPEIPTRSGLPSGTVVPIRAVGTAADGSLAVPEDIRVAGWWRGSARLGDPFGSTLVAAHVDSSTQGLGPFASLLGVRPRQRITLTSPHLVQTFTVVSLELVPRGTLAQHPRIFSPSGPRRLTLVTCAGPFDADRGGYQNLAVVTARADGDVERRAG